MFSYYIFERSYRAIGVEALQANLMRLQEVFFSDNKHDGFFKSDRLEYEMIDETHDFSTCIYSELPDKQFMRNVLPGMLHRIRVCKPVADKKELDSLFPTLNAFWGEVFKPKENYCLSTKEDYLQFRRGSLLANITSSNFWEWKEVLFRKIKFCDSVEQQVASLGKSRYFRQVIDRLVELDEFNQGWTKGICTANQINQATNLRVSNESDSVRNDKNLKRLRTFQLPEKGSSEYFEMHIKTGDLRMHFFPLESNHTIYIGYIGSHLPLG